MKTGTIEFKYFLKDELVRTPEGVGFVVMDESIINDEFELSNSEPLIQHVSGTSSNSSNKPVRMSRSYLQRITQAEYDEEGGTSSREKKMDLEEIAKYMTTDHQLHRVLMEALQSMKQEPPVKLKFEPKLYFSFEIQHGGNYKDNVVNFQRFDPINNGYDNLLTASTSVIILDNHRQILHIGFGIGLNKKYILVQA